MVGYRHSVHQSSPSMKSILLLLFLPLAGLFPADRPMDSPVTSTPFHKAYMDVGLVQEAAETKQLTDKMVRFLLKRRKPLDQKLAILNALSWDHDGTPFFDQLAAAIQKKRKIHTLTSDSRMRAHDQMLLGYMLLLEDYFHPRNASPYIENAAERMPSSRAAQTILAICLGQISFDTNWCDVWRHYERVELNAELDQDFREEAAVIVHDYLVLYKGDCQ